MSKSHKNAQYCKNSIRYENHFAAQKFVRGIFENSLINVEAAAIKHQKY